MRVAKPGKHARRSSRECAWDTTGTGVNGDADGQIFVTSGWSRLGNRYMRKSCRRLK